MVYQKTLKRIKKQIQRTDKEIQWTTGERIFDGVGFEYEVLSAGARGAVLERIGLAEVISLTWKEVNNDKVFKFHKK